MKIAAREALLENDGDIIYMPLLMGVGAWTHVKKSIVSVTNMVTGQVMEVECLSRHCPNWNLKVKKEHQCKNNYTGTSEGVEWSGFAAMFNRSVEQNGIRYTQYLGDRDCKAFQHVHLKPYGNAATIEKLKCEGHVKKRMGARLRNIRSVTKTVLYLKMGKKLI